MIDTQTELENELDHSDRTTRSPATYSPEPQVGDVVRKLLRAWWIIVLCGVIALAVGLGVSSRARASYSSTAYVLLNTNNFQQAVAGGYTPVNPQTEQATAISMLTPQHQAAAAAAAGLSPNSDYAVDLTSTSNSSVLNVSGSASSPRGAAALANAAADQMLAVVRESNAAQLREARTTVRTQLKAAKGQALKRPLAAQLSTFATLEALADNSMEVIQRATIPGAPSGTSKKRIAGIALLLGLVVGVAIAVLRPDRRVRARV